MLNLATSYQVKIDELESQVSNMEAREVYTGENYDAIQETIGRINDHEAFLKDLLRVLTDED
jgi:hypothetical protein